MKPAGEHEQCRVDFAKASESRPVSVVPAAPAGAGSDTQATKSCSGLSEANACSSTVKRFFTSARPVPGRLLLARPACRRTARARSVRRNGLVHQRLREGRFVAFVVAVTGGSQSDRSGSRAEARAIFPGQTRGLETGHRIVGVDVDDRDLEPARQPARVARAVGLAGRGRESDLVVGDDVNRAGRVVAAQAREVQRLGDNALTGKAVSP